jgi:hypothetical protein
LRGKGYSESEQTEDGENTAHRILLGPANKMLLLLERFSNLCALVNALKGGFYLRKKPLGGCGFGVVLLENRCRPRRMQNGSPETKKPPLSTPFERSRGEFLRDPHRNISIDESLCKPA